MTMRTLALAFTVSGLTAFLVACNATMDPSPPPAVEAFLNAPFGLSAGQTAVLAEEHLSLTFLGVLDDTRCEIDTVCIQAGNATMSFQVEQEGRPRTTLSLLLFSPGPQAPVYEGFRIDVQQLMPNRKLNHTIRAEDYRVQLLVDRP